MLKSARSREGLSFRQPAAVTGISVSAMQDGSAANNEIFSLTLRRNCSLNETERWSAFWLAALVSALIALAFAAVGAWPILPFAGLEVAALYVAFRCMSRDAGDYEQVIIRHSSRPSHRLVTWRR